MAPKTFDDLYDDVLYIIMQWLMAMIKAAGPYARDRVRRSMISFSMINSRFRSLAASRLFGKVEYKGRFAYRQLGRWLRAIGGQPLVQNSLRLVKAMCLAAIEI